MSQEPTERSVPYSSLPTVSREVEAMLNEQERRASSFDTKAGALLAFCAVIIGLTPDHPNLLHILGKVFAAVAAGAAAYALFPRISGAINPRALRNKYLAEPEAETALRLLDTKIVIYERDEKRLTSKVDRLRVAVWCLAVAVLLLLAASIVGAATEGESDDPGRRPPEWCHGATCADLHTRSGAHR